MTRRIQPRPYRVGTGNQQDPEYIEELQKRIEKHARITGAKPAKAFSQVLKERKAALYGEDEEEQPEEHGPGAIEPHMGLVPGQDTKVVNAANKGRRSAKVIVKG